MTFGNNLFKEKQILFVVAGAFFGDGIVKGSFQCSPVHKKPTRYFYLCVRKGTPKTTTPLGVIVSVKQMAEPSATICLYFNVARKRLTKTQGNIATMAL